MRFDHFIQHNFIQHNFIQKNAWARRVLVLAIGFMLLASASVATAAVRPQAMFSMSGEPLNLPVSSTVYAGEVFIDVNRNGIRDHTETGLNNIFVRVETLDGSLINETASDAEGYYIFSNLPEDTLRVRVVPPSGYHISANGEYVISTVDPQSPTVHSTGLFPGVFIPLIGK